VRLAGTPAHIPPDSVTLSAARLQQYARDLENKIKKKIGISKPLSLPSVSKYMEISEQLSLCTPQTRAVNRFNKDRYRERMLASLYNTPKSLLKIPVLTLTVWDIISPGENSSFRFS
jgi:hypothetical protein